MTISVVTLAEALHIISRLFDTDRPQSLIRDSALLMSALDRQSAAMFGHEAYPGIHHKAAAVLHGLTKNHALFDGNKRLALMATLYLYAKNGYWNTTHIAAEYDLMLSIASDELDSIDEIAAWLAPRFTRE